MNSDQIEKMFELFQAVREDTITDQQFSHLDQLLAENELACKYYFEFINMCANLKSRKALEETPVINELPENEDSLYDERLWQALANDEKVAPPIQIEKPKIASEIQHANNEVKITSHKISKPLLFTAILSTAAMFFLLVYVNFILPPPSQEVATITGSFGAQWADTYSSTVIGSRLRNQQGSLWLQKGLVEIEFDYGAKVLIQAPANFELETAEEISLHTGRLFAKVPTSAIGFTVHTPTSSILDLGTEFGVKVDMDKSSDIHVFKGKTSLMLGPRGSTRSSQILTENHALRVKPNALKASEITVDEQIFTMRLPSPYERAVLNSRPHAYWRFEDDLSALAMNSANKSQYNGRFSGNCGLEEEGPSLGDGQSNTALVLNGQDSSVIFENISDERTEKYSIVMWIRPDVIGNQNIITSTGIKGTSVDYERQLRLTDEGHFIHYDFREGKDADLVNGEFLVSGKTTVVSGQWYHVAMTADEYGQIRLFVNGQEDAEPKTSISFLKGHFLDVHIGTNSKYIDRQGNKSDLDRFQGAVDEISRYNRVLSPEEIQNLYSASMITGK